VLFRSVTANHVVADADEIEIVLQDGRTAHARVVGLDPGTDIAVLKTDATGLVPARFVDLCRDLACVCRDEISDLGGLVFHELGGDRDLFLDSGVVPHLESSGLNLVVPRTTGAGTENVTDSKS
jgi:hypothetical protein